MRIKAFEMIFIPVAISIICGLLISVNQVVPILPNWPIWGLLIISTIVAFCVIASVLAIGFAQWLTQRFEQYLKKQTM